uniref:Putative capsid protein n=1 Tax=viral metagenome TaxID=1070528 RepID=A0A6M3LYG1_9ZZZZ
MLDINQVHVDAALSNISVMFKNAAFVAEQVLPVLQVQKESDKFYKYNKQDAFKLPDTIRADGAEANEASLAISTDNYAVVEHALKDIVTDRVRANADAAIKPDIDITEWLTNLIMLRLEKEMATLLTSTTNITNNTTLSGTSQWSDYDNSTPLSDIKTAKASVRQNTGREANTITLGGDVAETLSLHPEIKDLRKRVDASLLTDAGLPPKILGLKVVEAKAVEDQAYAGKTASLGYVFGKNALVSFTDPNAGLRSLTLGRIIRAKSRSVRQWRDEGRRGTVIEVSDMFVAKLIAEECGYLIAASIA